jgi:alpha-tubulin suppressor-like RCC1 family protein
MVNGSASCWGSNLYGQLGDGSTTERHAPVLVSGLSSGVVSVSAGSYHSCAVTSAGAVKCWGDNLYGELGNNSTNENDLPVGVTGLSTGIVSVAAGRYATCAVTSAGGVKCWGKNLYGQLGNNSTSESHVPVDVTGLSSGVLSVSVGDDHACAVTSAGAVKCWGKNLYGQLGNNSTTESHVPVAVMGLATGAVAVSASEQHTCAVTSAGAVKCWGKNLYGQLGDSTTTERDVPVDVVGLASGVVAVAAGADHTCALTSAGAIKCWGSNGDGRLGNNSTSESHVPVDVAGVASGGAVVTAGSSHTCAAVGLFIVECWGDNLYGQLGNNSTTDSHVPIVAIGP